MKKKKFKATLAVALVAAAGLGAYRTYQDYKADKESTLVMQNIEALTEDDTSGGTGSGTSSEWYLHHFTCDPQMVTKTQAKKLLGFIPVVTIEGNLYADLSSLTQYFNHVSSDGEGPCDKGEQKTCNDVYTAFLSILNK